MAMRKQVLTALQCFFLGHSATLNTAQWTANNTQISEIYFVLLVIFCVILQETTKVSVLEQTIPIDLFYGRGGKGVSM